MLGITAILMLNTIEKTFNEIWRIKAPRTGLRRLAVYTALLTLGPLLLVLGLSMTIYVFSLPYLSNLAGSQWGLWILPFVTSAAMYTLGLLGDSQCFRQLAACTARRSMALL